MPDDQLSQNEIDSLLASLGRGEVAPSGEPEERFRSVRPYDFRHPSKLSKDQLRTLQMILEAFARQASSSLSGMLRSQVQMVLVSIEQTVYDDYTGALPQQTVLNLVSADPLPGTFVFEYDTSTALTLIDRLLGGSGKAPQKGRALSDIEEVLLQAVAAELLTCYADSWAHVVPLQPQLQRLEYSPRFLQIAPRNMPVVLVLFDLRIQDWPTTMSLCLPYSVIEPIAAELNVQALFMPLQRNVLNQGDRDVELRLRRVSVPLVALLGTTVLSLETVSDLQVDDVIRLDGLAADPVIVAVNDKPTYIARPGLVRQSIGVQIVGVMREEEAS